MQTPVQGDLAGLWEHWRQIWVNFHIWTHPCHQLGIWFPYFIFHQAWSTPFVLIMLLHLSPASIHFLIGISFINSLVYSVHLFSLNSSFCTLFGVSFQKFQTLFSFYFLIFLLTHLDHKHQNKKIEEKLRKTRQLY